MDSDIFIDLINHINDLMLISFFIFQCQAVNHPGAQGQDAGRRRASLLSATYWLRQDMAAKPATPLGAADAHIFHSPGLEQDPN